MLENTDHILRCDRGRHCSCEGEGRCCSADSSPPFAVGRSGTASIPSGPGQTNTRQTHANIHHWEQEKGKTKLQRIVNNPQPTLTALYEKQVLKKASRILADDYIVHISHPHIIHTPFASTGKFVTVNVCSIG